MIDKKKHVTVGRVGIRLPQNPLIFLGASTTLAGAKTHPIGKGKHFCSRNFDLTLILLATSTKHFQWICIYHWRRILNLFSRSERTDFSNLYAFRG